MRVVDGRVDRPGGRRFAVGGAPLVDVGIRARCFGCDSRCSRRRGSRRRRVPAPGPGQRRRAALYVLGPAADQRLIHRLLEEEVEHGHPVRLFAADSCQKALFTGHRHQAILTLCAGGPSPGGNPLHSHLNAAAWSFQTGRRHIHTRRQAVEADEHLCQLGRGALVAVEAGEVAAHAQGMGDLVGGDGVGLVAGAGVVAL